MADLPISSLPEASTTSPGNPLAVVVGGTTSKATVNTILTTFTSNSTKSSSDLTDQLMIYDGTLLKTTVQSILESFLNLSLQSSVDTSSQLMIYQGSLLRTNIDSLLQSFVNYSNKNTLDLTDQVMIYDVSMRKTTINSILYSFISSAAVTTPDLTDELMINSGVLSKVTITDLLESFNQYINKSGLSGNEQVMIYDPDSSEMRKTTIDEIIGSIISPTHYVYYGVETNSSDGNYRVRNIGGSGNFEFTFSFPTDMASIIDLYMIAEPANFSDPVGVNINLSSSYGNADSGELVNAVNGNVNIVVPFPNVNEIVKIPITDAFSTTGGASRDAQAGDLAGLMIDHLGIGGSVNYYMLELVYEGPGGSGSTVLVIDNLTSTSTVDALSANQGRVLNENKQEISTLQTDIEALSFDSLTVVDAPVANTDVTNKAYVDSVSNLITVVDNLTSTSATDALSANQGRVLNITKQDISTLQTDIEAINFDSLTVVDAPVNITDVVNKEYVDSLTPVTVVDNLTSTSATDALSANQGRVLNITKQDISSLKTDIETINFDSLTVIDSPTNANDVANKAYVDSVSNPITVIDNLTSVSASNALSANQGRILNITKQDISTLQTDIEGLSFSSLIVTDAPVNSTDVANKDYVDNSSSTITVIDNLTSTSTVDALSANQGRILNNIKQDISTLQTDIEAIGFNSLTVSNIPSSSTDVANKFYVDNSSGGIFVIDNLTSTSTVDALSANQGRVLNENKQDISTLQTDIEALSFDSLTVVNDPINSTDVANKNYVDNLTTLKQFWVPVPNPQDFTSTTPPIPIPPVYRISDSNSEVRLSFFLPSDYTSINSASMLYTRPESTGIGVDSRVTVILSNGAINQQANNGAQSSGLVNLNTSSAVNNIKSLDISSIFSSASALDLLTFLILHQIGDAAIDIIGIIIVYE